ncbi:N-acetyl-D-Glu racemase DgcA [Sphingomonas nostoxanthinifaciens]|uniref:N-acetyl-D-Glu racemase DgcA n=1 Tax=Sphingomonas nostoxanthinifaciens TaxID=2872652 RepID=UPI001CC1C2BB|nr:N-acetyl-D-Glu racemase DgcA [Sphingomonas nostoxanthinifaciens]UAK23446.1 dipeptide epimerase [Sphingomonas nostoxanthinifaciens]
MRILTAAVEHWPLAKPFRIARGTRTMADVVVATVTADGLFGRGEGVPLARYGETAERARDQIVSVVDALAGGAGREELRALLPPGAARNAVDCALWDLEARLAAAGGPPLSPIATALTVGIDTPARMAEAARALADARVVKVKVDADDPAAALRAVRAEVPAARLVVDANESWSLDLLAVMQPVLAECGVEFLEQPLPAAEDAALGGFVRSVPICADESAHVAADLDRLATRYDMVNIKLDKSGGLTEALYLLAGARARGLGVMVGCMISTSLSIAAAWRVAQAADCADLDGPLWLREDRPGGVRLDAGGMLMPPEPGFWGQTAGLPSPRT